MALTTVPASLSATALTLTTAAQPNITSVGTLTGLTVSGNIAGTLTTAAQTNITSLGTLTALTVDDITIDGSTISDAGGFLIDVGGDITLDADGADINFSDGGTLFGQISNSSGLYLVSNVSNAPMYLRGNDGGSYVNAIAIDFQNGGNVGIGTPNPTQKLDVRGGSGAGTLTHAIFTGTASRGLEIRTRSDTSGGQNSGTAEINSADSEGTGGDLAFSSNGNVRMFIDGGGEVGIGTSSPAGTLHLRSTATGATPSLIFENTNNAQTMNIDYYNNSGSVQSRIRYSEGPGSFEIMPNASANAAMILLYNGNVGIGETSPFSKLHVKDTSWSSGSPYGTVQLIEGKFVNDQNWGHLVITDEETGSGQGGSLRFATGPDSSLNPFAGIQGVAEGTSYGGLGLYTRPSGGTATERMRIYSDGKVDIKNSGTDKIVRFINTGSGTQGVTIGSTTSNSAGTGVHIGHQGTKAFIHPYNYAGGSYQQMEIACSDFILKVNGSDTGMTIDNTGSVTMPKQPYVQGRGNGGWAAFSASAIWETQPHGSSPATSVDRNSDYSTTNKRFTAPVDGVYLVMASWYIYQTAAASAGGQYIHPAVWKNGSIAWNSNMQPYTIVGYEINRSGTGSKHYDGVQMAFTVYCSANDYIEIKAYTPNSNTQSYENYHYFSYTLLS